MKILKGTSAFKGIAIGKVHEFKKPEAIVPKFEIQDIKSELLRFNRAKDAAASQLESLYTDALNKVGTDQAAIFEIHKMMLEDEDFLESIYHIISDQHLNAEHAVFETGSYFSNMFTQMNDEYMSARSADIHDICERLLCILTGQDACQIFTSLPNEPYILLADDLSPSETIRLDQKNVLAFVTRKGSTTSHTAILARTMNIPALVSTSVDSAQTGQTAIVDGNSGLFILDPDKDTITHYHSLLQNSQKKQAQLKTLKGHPSITADGKKIHLYANISSTQDLDAVLDNDSEGIGLFRSEFLYLQSDDYPDEDTQFKAYKTVALKMGEKKVIIRTLDIGADKQVDYFHLKEEVNPALGKRAIRICLTQPEIFKTQLRALYRASIYGNISIMIPMVISLWEVLKVKEMIQEVQNELSNEGIPFKQLELGIMIETPAAVLLADELAKEVDFFSIGTNDLTQYTLAIDRQNSNLEMFYDSHHPAVLKMIKMVINSAHAAGIWAGICGEIAADTTLTDTFIKMGVDELSVSPSMILSIREKILHSVSK